MVVFAMAADLNRAKDLFKWNERVLAPLGIWPLKSTYTKFILCTFYLVIHIITEFADLVHVFGNYELMILNLSESILAMLIFVKMMVMRFSQTLRKLMNQIIDDIDSKHQLKSPEEREIYLNYNRVSKTFFRVWLVMGFGTAVGHHMQPVEYRLRDVVSNESIPFVLPYRTRLFFDVDDSMKFWLVFIYQSPMIYYHAFHSVSIGYLFSIVLHVCGKLSVLASRIKSLDVRLLDDAQDSKIVFRDIIQMHINIVGLTKDIDQVFNLLLLEELAVSSILVGLASYTAIVHLDDEDKTTSITFFSYGTTVLLLIYGYCVAGEYLINESTNVHKAYYECRWYDLSSDYNKQIIICMIGATKPLQLTGGGFYIFSLAGYTSVLKTVMGYVSMLRTIA